MYVRVQYFVGILPTYNHDHGIGEDTGVQTLVTLTWFPRQKLGNEAKMSGAQHAEEILSLWSSEGHWSLEQNNSGFIYGGGALTRSAYWGRIDLENGLFGPNF